MILINIGSGTISIHGEQPVSCCEKETEKTDKGTSFSVLGWIISFLQPQILALILQNFRIILEIFQSYPF